MNISSDAPLLFMRSLLSNPLRVGAVVPSSSHLSRRMASRIDAGGAPVIEIGAGTGAITREIISRGVDPRRLLVVERDPAMAAFLRLQFPNLQVRCGDALHCRELLAAASLERAGTVVSSLPLRNLSTPDQLRTVRAMMSSLQPDGQLIQFTYAAGCPIPSRRMGLRAECLGRIWKNLPPAAVWRFTFNSLDSWERCGPSLD